MRFRNVIFLYLSFFHPRKTKQFWFLTRAPFTSSITHPTRRAEIKKKKRKENRKTRIEVNGKEEYEGTNACNGWNM